MKKKILKIVGVVVLVFIGILVAVPFLLESKIGDIIKNNVNNNVNATLDFAGANLSLISSFPSAEVTLRGINLVNKEPFLGDTLFAAERLELKMGIGELFKSSGGAIAIKTFVVDGARLHIKIDGEENANYDIGKESGTNGSESEATEGFKLNLQSYEISDSRIVYEDLAGGMKLVMDDIRHRGTGDLSLSESELETTTNAMVSFEMDSTKYLNKNKIKLDALIGIDLEGNKYTFLRNEALVNQLPLVFEGFVKVNPNNQEVDISFKTPSSDFKNFLALIPETYSKNIENVKTTGECLVAGEFSGIVDEEHIPKFKIDIKSDNASFKYPDLPKTVRNIHLDVALNNETGISEDTYVVIRKASFMIDSDRFELNSRITDLLGNTKVDAHLDGILNLAHLSQAYPVPDDLDLSGILTADVSTVFDMASIGEKRYENTKTSGRLGLKEFEYNSPEFQNPVKIASTTMTFDPVTVTLNEMNGSTGQTDFKATGTIDNLLGFMFNDEKIEGNFNLNSNTFAIDDFMSGEVENGTGETETDEGQMKIPSFLDCNISATAGTVIYDNLTLKNVKGNLRVVDEKAVLSNMTSSLFNGKASFNGEVSTKNEVPSFAMKLGMDQLGIAESFRSLELLRAIAPIAKALQGKLNSDIELSGELNPDFTPNLNTVTGKVLAELLSAEINMEQTKVLSALSHKLDFIDMDKLDIKGLKTALSFENGTVMVKPFTITYKDMAIEVAGSHTFDKKMNYKATLGVPARYLGSEVNNLIANIDEGELDNLTIPVTANIGGNYTDPEVSTDLTSGVKTLTAKLVHIQKQKLIDSGKDKVGSLLGNVLTGNTQENDSTLTAGKNTTGNAIKDIVGGILGDGKEGKKDSVVQEKDAMVTPEDDPVEETARNILGNLLGGEKKQDTSETQKDSIN